MEQLSLAVKDCKNTRPVRIVQFGEGNFLRGFIDWMVYKLYKDNLFDGSILAVQPTPRGRVLPKLVAQDCLYTTILHGIVDGKPTEQVELVNSISCAKNPYDDAQWQDILSYARDEKVEFVFSNTTEAGIVYEKEELTKSAPLTFPGKLAIFLYERFKAKDSMANGGEILILPCELIEDNGTKLKEIVKQKAVDYGFDSAFNDYLDTKCTFANTLVDRVVSGYPANAQDYESQLNYKDELMCCGEIFGFMAIEGDKSIEEKLPFAKIGLNVVVSDDISPYRLRKVRILNGGHTSNVPAAYLAGLETVDQMMDDPTIGKFARSVIYDEIVPCIKLDPTMLKSFADDVVNRFKDKSMHHKLASILMNSSSKVRARVIPSLLDARSKGVLPIKLCFAIAAYICLYKDATGSPVKVKRAHGLEGEFVDDEKCIAVLKDAWAHYKKTEASALFVVKAVLSNTEMWGSDLSSDIDVSATVAKLVHSIITDGIEGAMLGVLERN